MGVQKDPIDPDRVRIIPREGFSWIDRRFVRDRFMESLPADAILLYLFLVAVGDVRGLSFYADPTVCRILKLDAERLSQARARLVTAKLILYRYPLYQVLPLPETPLPRQRRRPVSRDPIETSPGAPLSLSELSRLAKLHINARRPPPTEEET